ncbi:MAG: DUF4263 domain-containing protein [Chloroflexota bacterium]|nr:DUF4263 domain-containing protein [Chloroflexota bacterium]
MQNDKEREIGQYFFAFFSTIREFLINEPSYQPYVPDAFKAAYLILTIKCTDGIVVATYLSGNADNYFYFEKEQTVTDVVRNLSNIILGTDKHIIPEPVDWDGDDPGRVLHLTTILVETSRGSLPTGGYQFLTYASNTYTWRVDDARKRAQEHIDIFKARAVIYEPGQARFIPSFDKLVQRQIILTDLFRLLEQYHSIINERNYRERVVHRFLRDHPVLLIPNKKKMWYEYDLREKRKLKYKMDFVIELTTERYLLVELENPNHRLFTSTGDFTQAVNHAERQVSDWIRWIRQNQARMQQELPGIDAPEGLIIIGRGTDLTPDQRAAIRLRNEQHGIKLMTYDDLAEQAENYIRHLLDV